MKIGQRLIAGCLVIAALVTAVTFVNFGLSDQVWHLRRVELPMEQQVREAEVSIWEAIHAVGAFVGSGDPRYRVKYRKQVEEVELSYDAYVALIDTTEEQVFAGEFNACWRKARVAGERVLALAGQRSEAKDRFLALVDEADDIIDLEIQSRFSPSDPEVLAKERAMREVEVSIWEALHAASQYTGLNPHIKREGHAQRTFAELMEKKFDDVDEFLSQYRALTDTEDEAAALTRFEERWDRATTAGSDVVRLQNEATRQFAVLHDQVVLADAVIDQRMQVYIQHRVRRRAEAAMRAERITLAISVLSILGSIAVGLVVGRSIWRPIRKLKDAANQLSAGNLAYRIGSERKDEIGDLARAFDHMGEELQVSSNQLRREIEDRIRVQEALRQERDYTENIIASMIDMLIVVDPDGSISTVNEAACNLLGFTQAELVGRPAGQLFFDESGADGGAAGDAPSVRKSALGSFVRRGFGRDSEQLIRARNGERIPVLMSGAIMRDGDGKVRGIVCVARDIVKLKEAETALTQARDAAEAANAAKSAFLANMSHEIRTPMTAILGFADVLLERDQLRETSQECYEAARTIKKNGEHLITIINDILDLSKVEAGRMSVERIPCDPCRLVGEVASLVKVNAINKGLFFQVEYESDIPEIIQTDPTRLRQILLNLVGNAIKFTECGGVRIIVRLDQQAEQSMMAFDVLDTGIGMTAEQVAALFQPFTQADASMTRKFGGTGLGLAISKRFAELLGGGIRVVHTEPGAATRMRATVCVGSIEGVRMVRDPRAATFVEPEPVPACSNAADLEGCRLLLAEDGPDNQRLITHLLKRAGADVTITVNGRMALQAALAARGQGVPFDVILMDMQMPEMDGYTAARRLREEGYVGRIIALTAHAMDGDRQKCIDAGCDDYATKPINRARLIETIRTHFRPGLAASLRT